MSARPLFFTGGSALAELCRQFSLQNIPSTHLVTTFDSGGSTAELRKAYAMPAVGDLRNRLLALAAPDIPARVIDFCASRLPKDRESLAAIDLKSLGQAQNEVWRQMPEQYAAGLRRCLNSFLQRLKPSFNPAGACLGNLALAGAYLEHKGDLNTALGIFSRLLRCRGLVFPIVDESLFLGARLADGSLIVGQHLFKNLPAPVARLFLTVHERPEKICGGEPSCRPPLNGEAREQIRQAGLVCYPMGSFYSSVLANLLPEGVGKAVAQNRGKKVFIPNSGHDPELAGLDLPGQAALIRHCLRMDAPQARDGELLGIVLVDAENGRYPGGLGPEARQKLADMGLEVVDKRMIAPDSPQRHDPEALLQALLEIENNG